MFTGPGNGDESLDAARNRSISRSLTGFVMNRSTPLANASRCVSALARPVNAMMLVGSRFLACSKLRILRVASRPSITGMERSAK